MNILQCTHLVFLIGCWRHKCVTSHVMNELW